MSTFTAPHQRTIWCGTSSSTSPSWEAGLPRPWDAPSSSAARRYWCRELRGAGPPAGPAPSNLDDHSPIATTIDKDGMIVPLEIILSLLICTHSELPPPLARPRVPQSRLLIQPPQKTSWSASRRPVGARLPIPRGHRHGISQGSGSDAFVRFHPQRL